MTNIYRLNRLGEKELEKVVGGSFLSVVRNIGCFMGVCDTGNYII